MKLHWKRWISALALTTAVTGTQAAIIDHGSYLSDTDTGLDWLDVTTTVGMSFNEVTSELTPGGAFDGWRYASGDEFNTLLGGYTGIYNPTYGEIDTTGTSPSVDGLVAMLGSTLDAHFMSEFGYTYDAREGVREGEGIDYTLGFIADASTMTGYQRVAAIYDREAHGSDPARDYYKTYNGAFLRSMSDDMRVGSYLVRGSAVATPPTADVAEPGTLALMSLGLLGLLGSRRKTQA